MGKVAPARPDRGRDDLPRWPGTEHMPLYGWKSTMCQSGSPFRGRIGDERTICALRGGRPAFGRGRIGDGDAARRAWGGSSPPRTGIAPRFQAECGGLGGCDGRRGGSAKEGGPGRGTRSAHMFGSQPEEGLFRPSDWHIVRFSPARPDRGRDGRSRGPIALARTPLGGRTPGSNPAWWQDPRLAHALLEGPWLEPRLSDSRSGEIGGIWQPPRLMD